MITFFKILLSPFSLIYLFVINIRNFLFDKNIFKSKSVSSKVISVGNITVGGSGKTPTVIYIVNLLKQFGLKTGILSRGYKRNSKGFLLVRNEKEFLTDINSSGDEIYFTARECNAPAAVAEKRVEGAEKFLKEVNLDTIVLDDAFQHRWIKRDFDLVVVDQRFIQKVNSLEQKLLPLGLMREPFSSLSRADAVILNHKFSDKIVIPEKYKKHFSNKLIFEGYYKAAGLIDVKTNKHYDLKDFQGQKSLIVCGIAKPYSFLNCLENNNIDFTNKMFFSDHINYSLKEVEEIRKQFYETNAFSVLTTEKDAVKLSHFSKELDDIDIYYLKIELVIEQKEKFIKTILNSINLNMEDVNG